MRPGSYVEIGRETSGPFKDAPIYGKVRWTRDDQVRMYPRVRILPERSIPVIVNGVRWDLQAFVARDVPSIVADVYAQSVSPVPVFDAFFADLKLMDERLAQATRGMIFSKVMRGGIGAIPATHIIVSPLRASKFWWHRLVRWFR